MRRYLVMAEVEHSPELVSALTGENMTVLEVRGYEDPANVAVVLPEPDGDGALGQLLDALCPPNGQAMTVAVNAPSADEAITKVRGTLSRWSQVPVEVIGEEPL